MSTTDFHFVYLIASRLNVNSLGRGRRFKIHFTCALNIKNNYEYWNMKRHLKEHTILTDICDVIFHSFYLKTTVAMH